MAIDDGDGGRPTRSYQMTNNAIGSVGGHLIVGDGNRISNQLHASGPLVNIQIGESGGIRSSSVAPASGDPVPPEVLRLLSYVLDSQHDAEASTGDPNRQYRTLDSADGDSTVRKTDRARFPISFEAISNYLGSLWTKQVSGPSFNPDVLVPAHVVQKGKIVTLFKNRNWVLQDAGNGPVSEHALYLSPEHWFGADGGRGRDTAKSDEADLDIDLSDKIWDFIHLESEESAYFIPVRTEKERMLIEYLFKFFLGAKSVFDFTTFFYDPTLLLDSKPGVWDETRAVVTHLAQQIWSQTKALGHEACLFDSPPSSSAAFWTYWTTVVQDRIRNRFQGPPEGATHRCIVILVGLEDCSIDVLRAIFWFLELVCESSNGVFAPVVVAPPSPDLRANFGHFFPSYRYGGAGGNDDNDSVTPSAASFKSVVSVLADSTTDGWADFKRLVLASCASATAAEWTVGLRVLLRLIYISDRMNALVVAADLKAPQKQVEQWILTLRPLLRAAVFSKCRRLDGYQVEIIPVIESLASSLGLSSDEFDRPAICRDLVRTFHSLLKSHFRNLRCLSGSLEEFEKTPVAFAIYHWSTFWSLGDKSYDLLQSFLESNFFLLVLKAASVLDEKVLPVDLLEIPSSHPFRPIAWEMSYFWEVVSSHLKIQPVGAAHPNSNIRFAQYIATIWPTKSKLSEKLKTANYLIGYSVFETAAVGTENARADGPPRWLNAVTDRRASVSFGSTDANQNPGYVYHGFKCIFFLGESEKRQWDQAAVWQKDDVVPNPARDGLKFVNSIRQHGQVVFSIARDGSFLLPAPIAEFDLWAALPKTGIIVGCRNGKPFPFVAELSPTFARLDHSYRKSDLPAMNFAHLVASCDEKTIGLVVERDGTSSHKSYRKLFIYQTADIQEKRPAFKLNLPFAVLGLWFALGSSRLYLRLATDDGETEWIQRRDCSAGWEVAGEYEWNCLDIFSGLAADRRAFLFVPSGEINLHSRVLRREIKPLESSPGSDKPPVGAGSLNSFVGVRGRFFLFSPNQRWIAYKHVHGFGSSVRKWARDSDNSLKLVTVDWLERSSVLDDCVPLTFWGLSRLVVVRVAMVSSFDLKSGKMTDIYRLGSDELHDSVYVHVTIGGGLLISFPENAVLYHGGRVQQEFDQVEDVFVSYDKRQVLVKRASEFEPGMSEIEVWNLSTGVQITTVSRQGFPSLPFDHTIRDFEAYLAILVVKIPLRISLVSPNGRLAVIKTNASTTLAIVSLVRNQDGKSSRSQKIEYPVTRACRCAFSPDSTTLVVCDETRVAVRRGIESVEPQPLDSDPFERLQEELSLSIASFRQADEEETRFFEHVNLPGGLSLNVLWQCEIDGSGIQSIQISPDCRYICIQGEVTERTYYFPSGLQGPVEAIVVGDWKPTLDLQSRTGISVGSEDGPVQFFKTTGFDSIDYSLGEYLVDNHCHSFIPKKVEMDAKHRYNIIYNRHLTDQSFKSSKRTVSDPSRSWDKAAAREIGDQFDYISWFPTAFTPNRVRFQGVSYWLSTVGELVRCQSDQDLLEDILDKGREGDKNSVEFLNALFDPRKTDYKLDS